MDPQRWFTGLMDPDSEWLGSHTTDDYSLMFSHQTSYIRYGGRDKALGMLTSSSERAVLPVEFDLRDAVGGKDHVVLLGFIHARDDNDVQMSGRYVIVISLKDGKATTVKLMTENSLALEKLVAHAAARRVTNDLEVLSVDPNPPVTHPNPEVDRATSSEG